MKNWWRLLVTPCPRKKWHKITGSLICSWRLCDTVKCSRSKQVDLDWRLFWRLFPRSKFSSAPKTSCSHDIRRVDPKPHDIEHEICVSSRAATCDIFAPNAEALPIHKTCSLQSLGVSYRPADLGTEEVTKTQTSVITVRNIQPAGSP